MQQHDEHSIKWDSRSSDDDASFCSMRVNVNGPNLNNLPKGWCTMCRKLSIYKCKRCSDFYCSPECQKKDWSSHRYICIPMAPLVHLTESCESYDNAYKPMDDNTNNRESDALGSEDSFEIGSVYSKSSDETVASFKNFTQRSPPNVPYPNNGSCVIFVGFRTINRCYIRSADPSAVEGYEKLMNKLNQYGKNAPKLMSPPEVDAYYITLHNGKYCRVQILSNKGDALFIDYGYIQPTTQCLYHISAEILAMPCFLKLVQIKVHYSNGKNKERPKLKRFLNCENRKFRVLWLKRGVDVPIAQLLHWDTNMSLSSDINYYFKLNKTKNDD